MADLGALVGSLMSSVIRARRIADEQTAALAEYYRDNPLLEGLSVPRVRIPELTIEMPVLIEDSSEGKAAKPDPTSKIADFAQTIVHSALARRSIETRPVFKRALQQEVRTRLIALRASNAPWTKEAVIRDVQSAFAEALEKSGQDLDAAQQAAVAKQIRSQLAKASFSSGSVMPGIMANIRTADVKERSDSANVVRLKITLKEEGLEWSTQASDTGGVVRTLQPE